MIKTYKILGKNNKHKFHNRVTFLLAQVLESRNPNSLIEVEKPIIFDRKERSWRKVVPDILVDNKDAYEVEVIDRTSENVKEKIEKFKKNDFCPHYIFVLRLPKVLEKYNQEIKVVYDG